jgi:hypothetical protein
MIIINRVRGYIHNIKESIYYLFNKQKVEDKIKAYKEYDDSLISIGITRKMQRYRTICLAIDLASFVRSFGEKD